MTLPKEYYHPPMGPVPANRDTKPTGGKAAKCPFIRPDIPSRCKWSKAADPKTNPHHVEPSVPRKGIMPNVLHSIGNTPLIRVNRIAEQEGLECELLAKCEFMNPGGSVKDRIALRMVEEAERDGLLKPGDVVIEATSGNTGIGMALAAAIRGYRCIIVLPEKMSTEKVDVLRALGAEIVRTPTSAHFEAPESHICVAQRLQQEIPNSIILDQYRNPGNPLSHYDNTAEEIIEQCGGQVDMVVVGAGTGGTLAGIGRKMKEKCPKCIVVGVDPYGSILAQPEEINETKITGYEVEGTGYDFIPTVLDRDVVDYWTKSDDKQSFTMSRRLIREEGLLCGGSSGGSMHHAIEAAKKYGLKKGQKCAVILADGVRNYMTKFLSDQWLLERDIIEMNPDEKFWWYDNKVNSLDLSAPMTVAPTLSVEQTLSIMNREGYDQLPVIGEEGKICGVVTLGSLKNKLLNGKIKSSDPVEKATYTTFKKVTLDTKLGKLNRILDVEHFVLVVHSQKKYTSSTNVEEKEVIVGIVTDIDLLHYLTASEADKK